MTQLINWDEKIIENIFLNDIFEEQNAIIKEVRRLYDYESNAYGIYKDINGQFLELQVLLINEVSFSIICKNVQFDDCLNEYN